MVTNTWTLSALSCKNCLSDLEKIKSYKDVDNLKENLEDFLSTIKKQYNKTYNDNTEKIDKISKKIGDKKYQKLRDENENESLHDLVTDRVELNKLVESKNEFFQKDDPIYLNPKHERFLDAQFYAPTKYFMDVKLDTFWANMIVIWLVVVLSVIALYYDLLRKFLEIFDRNKGE